MKKYYYDLHCHSNNSTDSPSALEEIIKTAQERGLTGIALTDHDRVYHGETFIQGIEIIPSTEISLNDGGHLLAFFVKNDFPINLSLEQAVKEIKKQNGYAVLAHPFRREYGRFNNKDFQQVKKEINLLDGVESGNASDSEKARNLASSLKSVRHDLFLTAGSDAHMVGQIGFGVVVVEERLIQENFHQVLSSAQIKIRPEATKYREKSQRWKDFLFKMKIAKILGLPGFRKLRKLFHIIILRSYFRFNSKEFSRIKFNFKKNA